MHNIPLYYWKTKKHIVWSMDQLANLKGLTIGKIYYKKTNNDLKLQTFSVITCDNKKQRVEAFLHFIFDQKKLIHSTNDLSSWRSIKENHEFNKTNDDRPIWHDEDQIQCKLKKYNLSLVFIHILSRQMSWDETLYTTEETKHWKLLLKNCTIGQFTTSLIPEHFFFSRDASGFFIIDTNNILYFIELKKVPMYSTFNEYGDINIRYMSL